MSLLVTMVNVLMLLVGVMARLTVLIQVMRQDVQMKMVSISLNNIQNHMHQCMHGLSRLDHACTCDLTDIDTLGKTPWPCNPSQSGSTLGLTWARNFPTDVYVS